MSEGKESKDKKERIYRPVSQKHIATKQQLIDVAAKSKNDEAKIEEQKARINLLTNLVELLLPSVNSTMQNLSKNEMKNIIITKIEEEPRGTLNKRLSLISSFFELIGAPIDRKFCDVLNQTFSLLGIAHTVNPKARDEKVATGFHELSTRVLTQIDVSSSDSSSSTSSVYSQQATYIDFDFKEVVDGKGNSVTCDYRAPSKRSCSIIFPRPKFVRVKVEEDQLCQVIDYNENYVILNTKNLLGLNSYEKRTVMRERVVCLELYDTLKSAGFVRQRWGEVLQDQANRFCDADGSINIPYSMDYCRADTAFIFGLFRQYELQRDGLYDTVEFGVKKINLNAQQGSFLRGGPDTDAHTLQVITMMTTAPTSKLIPKT